MQQASGSAPDLAFEDRQERCVNLLTAFEAVRAACTTKSVVQSTAALSAVLNTYNEWRNSLPLQTVASAARNAVSKY